LQLGHVPGDDDQEVVHATGHHIGTDHLRGGEQHLLERRGRPRVVAGQVDGDVDLQTEARRRRIEPGRDGADDAGLLEPADPVQGRRRGQTHRAGELDVRHVGVGLQQDEELDVDVVQFGGHGATLALVESPRTG
jgi:hypothetical protein